MTPRDSATAPIAHALRILVVAPTAPHRGGIAQFSSMLGNTLTNDHCVTFWAIDPLYPALLFPGNTAADPSIHPVTCTIDARLHGWNPYAWYRIWRTTPAHHYDVLIWQWWTPYWIPFLLMLLLQARLRGIPSIALNHQLVEPDAAAWQAVFARWMLALADAVIDFGTSSRVHRRQSTIALPIHGALLRRANPGLCIREDLGIPENATVVLCFGFVRPYKGIDIIVTALQQTPVSVHLLIVGEWWQHDRALHLLCDHEAVRRRVHIVDRYVPNEAVGSYFAAATVVAMAYRSGTVSGVATLAAAAGVPLLVSAIGALAGLAAVRDVVHPNTPDAWATALTRLCNEPGAPVAPVPVQPSWQALQRAIEEHAAAISRTHTKAP